MANSDLNHRPISELPLAKGKVESFAKFDMFTMNVLTEVIGFEMGSYALHCAGYQHIGRIVSADPEAILNIPGINVRKLRKISSFLRRHDLSFGMDTRDWMNARERRPKACGCVPEPGRSRWPKPKLVIA